jgi:triosephosphate isomerase
VVVGHSERREYHHEDDALVNAKIKAAFAADLTPIFCVGEGPEVRESCGHVAHCTDQIEAGLDGLKPEQVKRIVVAYEPVWAIGTGKTATPEDAQEVCGSIRARLTEKYGEEVGRAVRIQYGGSVKAANIAAIMAQPDIDGSEHVAR